VLSCFGLALPCAASSRVLCWVGSCHVVPFSGLFRAFFLSFSCFFLASLVLSCVDFSCLVLSCVVLCRLYFVGIKKGNTTFDSSCRVVTYRVVSCCSFVLSLSLVSSWHLACSFFLSCICRGHLSMVMGRYDFFVSFLSFYS
jgi:hypothetical protein